MHHHAAATGLTDHQIATIAVNSVFPAIAALFIGLRLWAKRIKHTALLLDDWLILLGFVSTATFRHDSWSDKPKVFVLGNSMPYIYGGHEPQTISGRATLISI